MIVVDSNVIAYFYLQGDHTAAADALFSADPEWSSPILWRSEFRSIVTGYLRRGQLTFEQAVALQREAEELLSGREFEVDSLAVLELANSNDCSSYDCEFVALARQLGTKLATMDREILRAFPHTAVALSDFGNPRVLT